MVINPGAKLRFKNNSKWYGADGIRVHYAQQDRPIPEFTFRCRDSFSNIYGAGYNTKHNCIIIVDEITPKGGVQYPASFFVASAAMEYVPDTIMSQVSSMLQTKAMV